MWTHIEIWFPWALLGIVILLLAAPVIGFCLMCWKRRKDNIIGVFDEGIATAYLATYHATQLTTLQGTTSLDKLEQHYHSDFRRALFVFPAILCFSMAALLLIPCAFSLGRWLDTKSLETGPFSLAVVLAIAGGYTWVLFDVIYKSFSDLLLPRDLYWGAFRFVVCVPVGYSLAAVFAPSFSLPMAFCLGALPTKTVFTLMRRALNKALPNPDAESAAYETELQKLPGIDLHISERLLDEGITCINQLAAYDPVRLSIRTGLPFGYVIGVIGDAILWGHLLSPDKGEAFRLSGINGAFGCQMILEDLWKPKYAQDQEDATAIVSGLATRLGVPEAAIRNLLWNVAHDPNSKFLYSVWRKFTGIT